MDNENNGGELDNSGSSRLAFLKPSSAIAALPLTPPGAVQAVKHGLDEKVAIAFEQMPLRDSTQPAKGSATCRSRRIR